MFDNPTTRALRRLREINARFEAIAEGSKALGSTAARHKCFISYHSADAEAALTFVEAFDSVFIPKSVGVSDEDGDLIESDDTDYVMNTIRDRYLRDSTVTIVLVGPCTWARRYVDWEVYSSLRKDPKNRLNGLLAIQLPDAGKLPERVNDNVLRDANKIDIGYGRYYVYPSGASTLRAWIEDAFSARTSRPEKRNNSRDRRKNNSNCP